MLPTRLKVSRPNIMSIDITVQKQWLGIWWSIEWLTARSADEDHLKSECRTLVRKLCEFHNIDDGNVIGLNRLS